MTLDTLLDYAQQVAHAGVLWRAKEMLQGGIRTWGYDQTLFERLGLILLQMGDVLEAGKYLFLSGRRQPSYEKPIALYLGRFTRRGPLQLYSTFPRAARLPLREDYPAPVDMELEQLGFPETLPAPRKPKGAAMESSAIAPAIVGYGCIVIVLLIFVFAFIGIKTVILESMK